MPDAFLASPPKGGPTFLHEKVERGSELTISVPADYIPTAEHAVKPIRDQASPLSEWQAAPVQT
jgi:hypothetical protein